MYYFVALLLSTWLIENFVKQLFWLQIEKTESRAEEKIKIMCSYQISILVLDWENEEFDAECIGPSATNSTTESAAAAAVTSGSWYD